MYGTDGHTGIFHVKGAVIDGVTSYVGGANLTYGSQVNGEMSVRLIGSDAAKEVEANIWSEAEGLEQF